MRMLSIFQRAQRLAILRRQAEPDIAKSTTKRKKFTGSYADLVNLPSGGSDELQDPTTGQLVWLMDYDPLP